MAAKKVLETTVILSAVDKMSRVINKAFKNADRQLGAFQKNADRISRRAKDIGQNAGAIGLAVAAPLVLATQKAIEFEEKMADVSKVLGLKRGSEELAAMATQTEMLGIHLGKVPTQAAEMIAALAQGGINKGELFDVGAFTGEMSVAFDMMAEQSGNAFAKTRNALGITVDQTKLVMDAVNHLSDNMAAKAPQIVDFLAGGGASSARMLNATGQEVAALGTTFIAMGKSGSEAGTIVSRMTKKLQKNSEAAKIYQKTGGGLKGIVAMMEAGNRLQGTQRSAFFAAFGEYGSEIALAATNMDLLNTATGLVADKTKYAGAVGREFANRSQTRAFEIARLQSQLQSTAIKIGNALLPVISQLSAVFTPMLEKLAVWIEKNPTLTAQIIKGTAIFAGSMLAVSGLAFAVSGVSKAFSFLTGTVRVFLGVGRVMSLVFLRPTAMLRLMRLRFLGVARVIPMVATGVRALIALMVTNPIGLAVAGIATAGFLIYKYWTPIKGFFVNLWDGIKTTFASATTWISSVTEPFLNAGANVMSSIWQGMKNMAHMPVTVIKELVTKMRAYLPFSPAKVGPFRDLHRVKIIETIAQSMNPRAGIEAMNRTVTGMVNIGTQTAPGISATGGGGGGISIVFNPTINLGLGTGGGDVKGQLMEGLATYKTELLQMIREAQRIESRGKF